MAASNIDDFCFRMPKCELHAHLNGSLSMKTIEKLAAMKAENDPDYCGLSEAERELLKPTERQRSLDEVFRIFPVVQNLIQHKGELTMATVDVIGDFESENVVYLELRSTPKSSKGMSKRDYVEAILDGIKFARRIHPNIVVRLILSIDRRHTLEEASDIMGMALEMGCGPNSVIVGVELSGDPKYDGRKFLPLFTNAAQAGLSTTLHVAESRDHLDELYDCLQLNADRIGHGTFIHQISDVMQRARCIDYVLEMRTPIEICLTSNVVCNTTASYADSHFAFYFSKGHPVVLCTDDRGVMNCSLSGEYTIAAKTFGLSREQLFQLSVTAFKSMFIQGREDCREDVDKIASSFRRFAHLESLA
ncbi:Adenosine deaminase-like protein [Toxocara canis]|uniref:Adenosine deaminase-like protein n=1 Tax=Toxocara canis TaxID=6265 RepID=A0A0B2W6P7_TOXCA|nr:Adenosine deaminase-like protein [Toxocara canis]